MTSEYLPALLVLPLATFVNAPPVKGRRWSVTVTPPLAPLTSPETVTGVLKTVGLGLLVMETGPGIVYGFGGFGFFWASATAGTAMTVAASAATRSAVNLRGMGKSSRSWNFVVLTRRRRLWHIRYIQA